jgi:hypothetical protein
MARQSSRYFTPVIKKLLDARQKENIVIDQEMKQELRAQLMARIGEFGLQEEKEGFNVDGLLDFFGRWKYRLAAVPVLLILCLVGVQAFKMTVKVPTDVVVPAANYTMQSVQNGATREASGAEAVALTETQEESKIKTFAGGIALPSDGKDSTLVAQVMSNSGLAAAENGSSGKQVEENDVVNQKTVEPVKQDAAPAFRAPAAVSAPAPMVVSAQFSQNNAKSSYGLVAPSPSLIQVEASIDEAMKVVNGTAAGKTYAPRVKSSLNIQYFYDFPADEKSDLEESVIAGIAAQKNATIVNVSNGDLGVTVVEFICPDGSREIRFFRKNYATGKWDEVSYTKKYYYDDDLEYDNVNMSSASDYAPDFYVPFQDANGY